MHLECTPYPPLSSFIAPFFLLPDINFSSHHTIHVFHIHLYRAHLNSKFPLHFLHSCWICAQWIFQRMHFWAAFHTNGVTSHTYYMLVSFSSQLSWCHIDTCIYTLKAILWLRSGSYLYFIKVKIISSLKFKINLIFLFCMYKNARKICFLDSFLK